MTKLPNYQLEAIIKIALNLDETAEYLAEQTEEGNLEAMTATGMTNGTYDKFGIQDILNIAEKQLISCLKKT